VTDGVAPFQTELGTWRELYPGTLLKASGNANHTSPSTLRVCTLSGLFHQPQPHQVMHQALEAMLSRVLVERVKLADPQLDTPVHPGDVVTFDRSKVSITWLILRESCLTAEIVPY